MPGGNVVRPKHAKARPSRVIVPVLVALLVLGGGSVAVYQLWPDSGVLGAGPLEVTPTGSAAPTAAVPSAPSSSANQTANAEAEAALADCRAKISAGDRIVVEAKTGVGHWNEHVQAQTDAYAQKINADQLTRTFTRTRRLGPADLKRYHAAVEAYRNLDGSCAVVEAAADDVADGLTACRDRAGHQNKVLAAANDAMGDWASHQRDMARSRHRQVRDAEKVWIDTWKAAAPHLKAWKSVIGAYRPPAC